MNNTILYLMCNQKIRQAASLVCQTRSKAEINSENIKWKIDEHKNKKIQYRVAKAEAGLVSK